MGSGLRQPRWTQGREPAPPPLPHSPWKEGQSFPGPQASLLRGLALLQGEEPAPVGRPAARAQATAGSAPGRCPHPGPAVLTAPTSLRGTAWSMLRVGAWPRVGCSVPRRKARRAVRLHVVFGAEGPGAQAARGRGPVTRGLHAGAHSPTYGRPPFTHGSCGQDAVKISPYFQALLRRSRHVWEHFVCKCVRMKLSGIY